MEPFASRPLNSQVTVVSRCVSWCRMSAASTSRYTTRAERIAAAADELTDDCAASGHANAKPNTRRKDPGFIEIDVDA